METLRICVVITITNALYQYLSSKSFWRLKKFAISSCAQLFSRPEKLTVIPFFDVIPTATNYKCGAPTGCRRCGRGISQKNCSIADSLRRGLSICPLTHPSFKSMLESYARACLCTRQHSKDEPTLSATVNAWSDQLRYHFESITIQHTKILLCMPGALDIHSPIDASYSLTLQLGPSTCLSGSMEHAERDYKALFDALSDEVELGNFPVSDTEVLPSSGRVPEDTPWSFQPYCRAEERTLEDVIWSPLGVEDRKPGHIYAFTREEDESHIKIGYTKDNVTSRMTGWRRSCNYEPIIIRGSESKVPNAKRIETLIHVDLELRSLRRREAWCRTNKNCGKSHSEWFEISISQAETAIDYWISWMQTHTPYKENGQLDERCIVDMHLPPSLHESNADAPCFTSDSSGRSWFGATGEPLKSSDVLLTTLQVFGDEKTGRKGRRTSSEPCTTGANPSSENSPSTSWRTEPFCDSKSEPSFPPSAMLYPKEGHSAIDKPSKPSLARESNPSTPPSTAISGRPSTAELPKSNTGEKPPKSRQVSRETLGEDVVADPSPLAPDTGDYLEGSRQYPISIDSDTDVPQSLSRETRPSPAVFGYANTSQVKHEVVNAAELTPTLRIPGQDRRRRRRSAPSTSASDSCSAASKAKPGPQTPAFDLFEEWACSRCTYKNPIFSPKCVMCRHIEPGFAAVEDVDLPPLNHGRPGRKRRPHILDQMPASDPVVPLVHELGDEGIDEMPKPSRRAKGKARRRSDKDIRNTPAEESS